MNPDIIKLSVVISTFANNNVINIFLMSPKIFLTVSFSDCSCGIASKNVYFLLTYIGIKIGAAWWYYSLLSVGFVVKILNAGIKLGKEAG
jgi:hypothetical protein